MIWFVPLQCSLPSPFPLLLHMELVGCGFCTLQLCVCSDLVKTSWLAGKWGAFSLFGTRTVHMHVITHINPLIQAHLQKKTDESTPKRLYTHFAQPDPSFIPLVYSCAGHRRVEAVTQNHILLSHVVIQTACLKNSHHNWLTCTLWLHQRLDSQILFWHLLLLLIPFGLLCD